MEVVVLKSRLFDYVKQTRIIDVLGLYDAENCYDCVAHNFDLLTDQAFYIPFTKIIFCLKAIQEIKFFIRMVF